MKEISRKSFLQQASASVAGLLIGAPTFGQDPQKPPETMVYVCPMHVDVQSKLPGKCPKCSMKLVAVESSRVNSSDDYYLCPMHPDVTDSKPGSCPKCKMKLVKGAPPEANDFVVKMITTPLAPRPGQPVKMRFKIFHPVTNTQVQEFNLLHDMPFHLFVISQDFNEFQHIHPDLQPDGSFTITTKLPQAGYYKIFCDFFPKGGTPQVIHHHLVTAGFRGDLLACQAKLTPDTSFSKVKDGVRFDLKLEPAEIFAGRPAELRYQLTDVKTGAPVEDLKPYLAAWGHTLILSEDATEYLHSHPVENVPEDLSQSEREKLNGGPHVTFDTFFPRPGNYRVWSQFLRKQQLITVSFTLAVPRLG
jgi:Heavy metal binding domain